MCRIIVRILCAHSKYIEHTHLSPTRHIGAQIFYSALKEYQDTGQKFSKQTTLSVVLFADTKMCSSIKAHKKTPVNRIRGDVDN